MSDRRNETTPQSIAVGRVIERIRTSRNISQSKLARMCDLDHSHVSRLESGQRNISLDVMLRIDQRLMLTNAESRALRVAAGLLGAVERDLLNDPTLNELARVFANKAIPEHVLDLYHRQIMVMIDHAGHYAQTGDD